jgi:hypothetical protein
MASRLLSKWITNILREMNHRILNLNIKIKKRRKYYDFNEFCEMAKI